MDFVTGDTGPPIAARIPLLDADGAETGAYADLTDASVNFQMRRPDDKRYTVNQPAVIVGDPTDGHVRYDWATDDLSIPGTYQVQWEIVFADMSVQTTARRDISVLRQ